MSAGSPSERSSRERADQRREQERSQSRSASNRHDSQFHDDQRAVYVISVAAELAGVHPQTLRIYERKGLLNPARTDGGSRRYSDRDIEMLRRVQDLTESGLNLAGVKRVIELEAELSRMKNKVAELERQQREAVEQARREHRRDLVPVSKAITVYRRR
jgi:MerR family transcriptional regulator/heat shock protein HspR